MRETCHSAVLCLMIVINLGFVWFQLVGWVLLSLFCPPWLLDRLSTFNDIIFHEPKKKNLKVWIVKTVRLWMQTPILLYYTEYFLKFFHLVSCTLELCLEERQQSRNKQRKRWLGINFRKFIFLICIGHSLIHSTWYYMFISRK